MPRLETFDIIIKTGANGLKDIPKWSINGFTVDFEEFEGGCGPGEVFRGSASPGSFPHSLLIRGPEAGVWDVAEAKVTYYPAGEEPYSVRLGAVTLDHESDLNIWYERPQPVFDV